VAATRRIREIIGRELEAAVSRYQRIESERASGEDAYFDHIRVGDRDGSDSALVVLSDLTAQRDAAAAEIDALRKELADIAERMSAAVPDLEAGLDAALAARDAAIHQWRAAGGRLHAARSTEAEARLVLSRIDVMRRDLGIAPDVTPPEVSQEG